MRGRSAAAGIALALWLGAGAAAAPADPGQARDATGNIGAVRGPLSDFWLKVRGEWSGYMRSDPAGQPGGAPLERRTFVTPPPNRAWVSLVYGELSPKPLAHLFAEFLSEWRVAEGRNWPYAQIYDRRWDRMGRQGRLQNIIMIGTPWTLEPVGPLASGLGFTIAPGRIEIGKRRYRGDNLILVFIAPNPANPSKYALVVTGTNDEGLMQAGHLPYGETDYVLFRGRRLLESGFFSKPEGGAVWGPPDRLEATVSHSGFAIRETPHYVFWFEKDRVARERVDALAAEKEAGWGALVSLLPEGETPPRLSYYLYSTVDRKIDETSRAEVVHVDPATSEIHTVFSEGQAVVEPYLDLMALLHRTLGPTRAPRLERALAIALAPGFQGRQIDSMAVRLLAEARGKESAVLRSLRDPQAVITPADGPPEGHDILMAAFLRHLVARAGRDRVFELLRRASPRRLDEEYRRLFDEPLDEAIGRWAGTLRAGDGRIAAGSGPGSAGAGEAGGPSRPAALSSAARASFRAGRFDEAERAALECVSACAPTASSRSADCPEAEAWSRLTLGRIEALRGRYVAARVELRHPSVVEGPAQVATLADYWLETMGLSRNQLTVISHLKREARVSLRNLDWRRAETDLKKALEIDPTDSEAHKLLSEVYHKQHEYWAWQLRYINETHPDYNVLGRIILPEETQSIVYNVEQLHTIDSFNDLVLKGNLELLKAQSLYAVEIQNLHQEGERFLLQERDTTEALKTYLRALDLNRDFFLSHFLVGRCYFMMERYDEARLSFEEVLARRPDEPSVLAWTHTYLGYIALEEEDLTAAKNAFEKALARMKEGKVGALAREGLGRVSTIRMLMRGKTDEP